MTPLFRETITLLNRRAAEDSPDGLDAWKKTVLTGCVFVRTTVRSVSGADVSRLRSVSRNRRITTHTRSGKAT